MASKLIERPISTKFSAIKLSFVVPLLPSNKDKS